METENSVKLIEQRLDEHDADARSWLNTITPTDVRLLLAEISRLSRENIALREALERIASGEMGVPLLAPHFYGHGIAIAKKALLSSEKKAEGEAKP